MPDISTTTAAPPADDRLSPLVNSIARLVEQQQSLVDTLRLGVPDGRAAASAGEGSDVRAIVADLFKQHQTSATRTAARDAYVRDHLADLPDVYRRLLPETDDAAALASAEQSIRRTFRDDLRTLLRDDSDRPSVGADQPGGAGPSAAVDYSKLSPLQQITVGLRRAPGTAGAAKPGAGGKDAAGVIAAIDPDDAEPFSGSD